MRLLVLIPFLIVSTSIFAQLGSKIGEKSPDLFFGKILNYERAEANLSDFKGKIVVLDFWATWCATCIRSFSQLEIIQSKYNKDLQIFTITTEKEERIKRFLDKWDMTLPIVIDEQRRLTTIFPHRTIPHVIVLDKMGKIRAITTSSEITEDLITKILLGQELAIKEKKDDLDFDPSIPLSGNDNFTYQITITPFKDGFPSFSNPTGLGIYKGRRVIATNLIAKTLFEIAHKFPLVTRTILETDDSSKFVWNRQNAICFDLIVPEELGEQRFEIMRQQLSIYFSCTSGIEERAKPVKILQKIKGKPILLDESNIGMEPHSSSSGRGLKMKNSPIETLAIFLETRLRTPVVDETGLIANYDLEIPWYNENPENINQELKQIGLELVDDVRKIKVLVIKDKVYIGSNNEP